MLTDRLVGAQKNVPMEFACNTRALREIDRWKVTKFRQFLLYTGTVMLKDLFSTEMYINFLLFFCGNFHLEQ